jgi:hypothetical protein
MPVVQTSTVLAADPLATGERTVSASTVSAPPDRDTLIQQLQTMQNGLRDLSGQIEQRYGQPAPTAAGLDRQALLAEIERLNQVMQPLMEQIQIALQSERPASELAAMRVQMDEIHRRLAVLLEQVQAAGYNGTDAGMDAQPVPKATVVPAAADPNAVVYVQLERTLSQLQLALQQMQNDLIDTTP